MKFNIIITNRDRHEYVLKCTEKLLKEIGNHDIMIYIIQNYEYDYNCKNILSFFINDNDVLFNKSKYINYGISKMRKDFDYWIQWDNDLLCSDNFFDKLIKFNIDWITLGGIKLLENGAVEPYSVFENNKEAYVGNICLNSKTFNLYSKLFGIMYNENMKGWGGEDSILSVTAKTLKSKGIITKYYWSDSFIHMWHKKEKSKDTFDKNQYNLNKELMNECINKNKKIIQEINNEN